MCHLSDCWINKRMDIQRTHGFGHTGSDCFSFPSMWFTLIYPTDSLHTNFISLFRPIRNHYNCTPQPIAEPKKNAFCKSCVFWGYWHSDSNPGGILKPIVKVSYAPPINHLKNQKAFPPSLILTKKQWPSTWPCSTTKAAFSFISRIFILH